MNEIECYQVETLAEIAALPAGHQRLAHLAGCPRCRALLAQYRSFMAAEAPAGADVSDAERRLEGVGALAGSMRAGGRKPSRRGGLGAWLSTPALRPAWGLAAVLAVAFAIWRASDDAGPGPGAGAQRVLRGSEAAMVDSPEPQSVTELKDGRLRLAWRPIAAADAYAVALHAQDLTEVARVDAGGQTSLELDARAGGPEPGREPRLWRVIALRGGDEIARSELAPLETSR